MLCIITLIALFGTCKGNSFLRYQEREGNISPPCEGDGWQIDFNQDNIIDCYFSCSSANKDTCEDSLKCNDTNWKRDFCKEESCDTFWGKSGFFACVQNSSLKEHLFPFKPTSNQIDSYIVTLSEPNLTSSPEVAIEQHVTKLTGEPVNLTCSFTISKNYTNLGSNVLWIKASMGGSSCLYSYSFSINEGVDIDHHCVIDAQLHKRLSNYSSEPTKEPSFHHLTISNLTVTDSGQYVCALQVFKGDKRALWKVITNITLSVEGNDDPTSDNTPVSGELDGERLIPVFIVSALLFLGLPAAVIVILVRRKANTPQESQIQMTKRDQDGEETLYSECSPYAVGRGGEDIYSLAKLPEGREPVEDQQPADLPVMVDNTLYEASTRQHDQADKRNRIQ